MTALPVAVQIRFQAPPTARDMVVDLPVLHADRASFVAAHAATDLLASVRRFDRVVALALQVPQACRENRERGRFVPVLRAFGLALRDKASRLVPEHNGRFRLVAMLTTRTSAALEHPFQVRRRNAEDAGFWFWKRRDCDSAGVNAPAFFGRWDPLPSVAAGFVREHLASGRSGDVQGNRAWPFVDYFSVKDSGARTAADRCGPVRPLNPSRRRHLRPLVSQ